MDHKRLSTDFLSFSLLSLLFWNLAYCSTQIYISDSLLFRTLQMERVLYQISIIIIIITILEFSLLLHTNLYIRFSIVLIIDASELGRDRRGWLYFNAFKL